MDWSNRIGVVGSDFSSATGFLVGPNDVLTNAHAVLDPTGRPMDNITVSFIDGTVAEGVFYNWLDVPEIWGGGGVVTYDIVRYDLAIITLDEPIGLELGWFDLAYESEWRAPILQVAGYPFGPYDGTELRYDLLKADYDLEDSIINFTSNQVFPGSSGSPVWMSEGGRDTAIAVYAVGPFDDSPFGQGAALLDEATYTVVQSWIEGNDLLTPSLYVGEVALLYNAALDRDGVFDWEGLNFWIDQIEQGVTMEEAARSFLASDEFRAAYGDALDETAPGYLDDTALLDQLYSNILGRAADPSGRDYWLGEMAAGLDRGTLVYFMATSPENRAGSPEIEFLTETVPGYWEIV